MIGITQEIEKLAKTNYFNEIETLKEKYNKPCNKFIGTPQIDLTYNKTITLNPIGCLGPNRQVAFVLPKLTDNCKMAFKNLRVNDIMTWESRFYSCELDCSGQRIDIIYSQIIETLRYVYDIDNPSVLPFSFCKPNDYLLSDLFSEMKIIFKLNDYDNTNNDIEFNLKIDVYDVCDNKTEEFQKLQSYKEKEIFQLQFNGEESAECKYSKYKLNFNHPITHLIFSTDNSKIEELQLVLDGQASAINLNNAHKFDKDYIVPLSNPNLSSGLNFSNINHAQINVKFSNVSHGNLFYCYAVNQQVLKIFSNCAINYSN